MPYGITVALDLTVKNPQSSSSYQVQGGGTCTLHHFIGFWELMDIIYNIARRDFVKILLRASKCVLLENYKFSTDIGFKDPSKETQDKIYVRAKENMKSCTIYDCVIHLIGSPTGHYKLLCS